MRGVVVTLAVGVALALAGCDEGSAPPEDPPEVLRCGAPADRALVLLENHGDHAFGLTQLLIVNATGAFLSLMGTPNHGVGEGLVEVSNQAAIAFGALGACMEVHRFPDTWAGFRLDLVRHGQLYPEALAALASDLEGFFDLPADSGAGCLSGGDSWMQVTMGNRTHTVEATCAPDEAFEDYQVIVHRATPAPQP